MVRKCGRARVSRSVVSCKAAAEESSFQAPLAVEPTDVWELDFYSRPVVGADGKKLWELIVTDSSGAMEHVETIPNSMVNSRELRARFDELVAGSRIKPRVVRYFRTQMVNMIRIALDGMDGVTGKSAVVKKAVR